MQEARIVVDHVRGSRRGTRQEFPLGSRVRFGRHPENEVAFHARRDLDASSRHAELGPVRAADGAQAEPHNEDDDGGGTQTYVLRDTGSSNGTLVDGRSRPEIAIPADTPVIVAFGQRGPVVRIFIGADPPAPVRCGVLQRLWDHTVGAPWAWPIWLTVALGLAALVAWVSLV
jgi:hypothetical protein